MTPTPVTPKLIYTDARITGLAEPPGQHAGQVPGPGHMPGEQLDIGLPRGTCRSASAVIASTGASSADPGTGARPRWARHSPALAASTARACSLSSV